jgi:hypothetical protein
VPARFSGRGKTSAMEVAPTRGCHLCHVRSGSVACQVFYWDREQAFANLGLSPEEDAADPTDRPWTDPATDCSKRPFGHSWCLNGVEPRQSRVIRRPVEPARKGQRANAGAASRPFPGGPPEREVAGSNPAGRAQKIPASAPFSV